MLRKTASLTSLLSFLLTLVTSVVLYIVPTGLGKKSLKEISADYGLKTSDMMAPLARRNIPVQEGMTLKQIGDAALWRSTGFCGIGWRLPKSH